MDNSVALTATLSLHPSGKTLEISYEMHNNTATPVWVLDGMLELTAKGFSVAHGAVIVRQADQAGGVSFVRGYVPAEYPVMVQVVPIARPLEPGQRLEGRAQTPLPLSAWHPNGQPAPLQGVATTAVVEIGYLSQEPKWASIALADGSKPTIPVLSTHNQQKFVRSTPARLP